MTIGTEDSGADLARHLDARQLGEHQVQQHEVGLSARKRSSASRPSAAWMDPEPVRLQGLRERLAERRLVLHDEDRLWHDPVSRTRIGCTPADLPSSAEVT